MADESQSWEDDVTDDEVLTDVERLLGYTPAMPLDELQVALARLSSYAIRDLRGRLIIQSNNEEPRRIP